MAWDLARSLTKDLPQELTRIRAAASIRAKVMLYTIESFRLS